MNLEDWSYVGGVVSGASAALLAIAAIIGGGAGLGDWRARQRKERELAEERAKTLRLDRARVLRGWSPHGVHVYGVRLVAEPAELTKAVEELTADQPSDYVVLRVNETADGNANRARSLRQLIVNQGYLAQAPSTGEYEALEVGRKVLESRTLPT
ncbi:hypothetical protein ACGFIY_20985 [Micromonospora chersina]|uniref:hypothetical protein n=1 Tax=Micromonospora chersina TaxID=47854 RepID=UPI0037240AC6